MAESKGVIVVAHPGHELRIHRCLELARPIVHVLTDGSGSQSESRLQSTRRVLETTGARGGSIFGRYSDRAVYDLLLNREFGAFVDLAEELAQSLDQEAADFVAGDMAEGYNSVHDVARLIIGAAVDLAAKRYGRQVGNYDFPLMGLPDRLAGKAEDEIVITLDEAAFERKFQSAKNYRELAVEVENALKTVGRHPFMREVLRSVPITEGRSWREPSPPYYETYGATQVAAGLYKQVIRFHEHIGPLARHIETYCASLRP
jgi:hypothetical protein